MRGRNRDILRRGILELLAERGEDSSICPSEAARRAFPDDWRECMDDCREAARQLADEGRIEICRGGNPIAPEEIRGPIRLRRAR